MKSGALVETALPPPEPTLAALKKFGVEIASEYQREAEFYEGQTYRYSAIGE